MITIKKETGSFQSFDGTSIYYESRGEGPPIILTYGIACLMNHWHPQVDYFSQNFRVILYDLRGHHKSSIPNEYKNLNIESNAKDLLLLIKHLNIEKAHYVAHSFGVPILIEAFSQDPSSFLTLSLINGFASNPIKGMFGLEVIEPIFYFLKNNYETYSDFWNSAWSIATHNHISQLITGLLGGFNLKLIQFKDIEIYTKGVAQLDLKVFLRLFEDLVVNNSLSKAKTIKIPTLIIGGESDNVTPTKFQIELQQNIEGSELVLVPYGSHCCQLDFPDYINLRIEKNILSAR